MSNGTESVNPYVGPVPFKAEQRDFFFGRDDEADLLLSLAISERLVLYYAQSGAGKSSLIHARLKPRLIEKGYEVLPVVRVGGTLPKNIDPHSIKNAYVFNLLWSLSENKKKPKQLLPQSLSSFLKERSLDKNSDKPYWLIIDQFEEILTAYPDRNEQERIDFFEQIKAALDQDPLLSVVFAMREDHTAALDNFAPMLPGRLGPRLRMERLKQDDAILAVTLPAALVGWSYAEHVAEELVRDLSLIRLADREETIVGEYVEPVHLQVVCKGLFDAVSKNTREQGGSKIITQADLKEYGDTDQALEKFYDEVIKEVLAQDFRSISERSIRSWFSDTLITQNRVRAQVNRGVFNSGDLPNKVIDFLVNKYLVREEQTRGGRWYELAHDRLIEPVLESNEKYFAKDSTTPITIAARNWNKKRNDKALLRGRSLQKAQRWYDHNKSLVSPLESEFLAASVNAEVRRSIKYRSGIIALVGLFVLALVLGFIAVYQFRDRANKRKVWERRGLATRLSADAFNALDTDPERSLLLSLHSLKLMNDLKNEGSDTIENEKVSLKVREVLTRALQNLQVKATLCNKRDGADCGTAADINSAAQHDASFSLTFGQDNNTLFSSSSDESIRVWNTVSAKRRTEMLSNLGSPINAIASTSFTTSLGDEDKFTTLLATVSGDGRLRFWDVSDVDKLRELKPAFAGRDSQPYSVAFSSDGKLLATGNQNGTINLWDVKPDTTDSPAATLIEGFPQQTDQHPGGVVRAVAFSRDGRWLAAAGEDKNIYLWDIKKKEQVTKPLEGHTDTIHALAFSPTGNVLASASEDMTVKLWDTTDWTSFNKLTSHTAAVHALAFSPDGELLATGSEDRTIRVWNTKTWDTSSILSGHHGGIRAVAFSSAQRGTGSAQETQQNQKISYAGPKNYIVASSSEDKVTKLWQVDPRISGASYLALSPDGKRQASLSQDGNVMVRNVESNQVVALYNMPDQKLLGIDTASVPANAYEPPFTKIVFNPVDYRLYVLSPRGPSDRKGSGRPSRALLWNGLGIPLWPFPEQEESENMFNLECSPDGRFLLTVNETGSAKVWLVDKGSPATIKWTLEDNREFVKNVPIHEGKKIGAIGFLKLKGSDEGYLATGDQSREIKLWKIAYPPENSDTPISFQYYTKFQHRAGAVDTVAFSPDGKWLASAGEDKNIYIWDIKTRQQDKEPLSGHTDTIQALAFSPDAKSLASRSADGATYLWNTDDRRRTASLEGNAGRVHNIAFADDSRLITTDVEQPVLAHYSDSKDLLIQALKRLPRLLSQSECSDLDTQEREKGTCDAMKGLQGVIEGNQLARTVKSGYEEKAIESYRQAKSYLSLTDEEIKKLVGEITSDAALDYARNYLKAGEFDRAIDSYESIDSYEVNNYWRDLFDTGQRFVQEGELNKAYKLYKGAQRIYEKSKKTRPDPSADAAVSGYYNNFCWFGSIYSKRHGKFKLEDVLPFCYDAKKLDQENLNINDTLGVALALTEDPKLVEDAIKYLTQYRDWTKDPDDKRIRTKWIDTLSAKQYAAAAEMMISKDIQ